MAGQPDSPLWPLQEAQAFSPSPSLLEGDPDLDFDFDGFLRQFPPDEREEMPPVLRSGSAPGSRECKPPDCYESVLTCFPDLCHDYFLQVAPQHDWDSERLVIYLLDEQEKGNPYPKRSLSLKRKRPKEDEKDEEEENRKKFESAGPGHIGKGRDYIKVYTTNAKILLKSAYPQLYSQDVESLLKENDYRIYPTYLMLDKVCTGGDADPRYRFKKVAQKRPPPIASLIHTADEPTKDARAEFEAASAICQSRAAKVAEEKRKEQEEADNVEHARAEGTISECGCCFEDLPQNRMVHCNGSVIHWFCRSCARLNAENVIGLSKYQLNCMSTDGCDATFRKDQKDLFLDDKLVVALDRIEQEAVLRMAGIENLETCPFCSYAEEYPPVEENKEFKCLNQECALVSCRHCRQETHIPKTCEEAARENGCSARRKIEEAMSAAMIRKCNKCDTPFIKENGCNKMTCTRGGCRNVQCYVCSKSCDYSHFDDSSRGGKKGNCPLFDSVEERHEEEVQAAENEARKQLADENPTIDNEMLKFNFSEKVKKDEEMRKAANPNVVRPFPPPMFMHGGGFVQQVQQAQQAAALIHHDFRRNHLQEQFRHAQQIARQHRMAAEQARQAAEQAPQAIQQPQQAAQQPQQAAQQPQQAAHQPPQAGRKPQLIVKLKPQRAAQQQQQAAQQPQLIVKLPYGQVADEAARRARREAHAANRANQPQKQAPQLPPPPRMPVPPLNLALEAGVRAEAREPSVKARGLARKLVVPPQHVERISKARRDMERQQAKELPQPRERSAKAREQTGAKVRQGAEEDVRAQQARLRQQWLDMQRPQAAAPQVGPFAWPAPAPVANEQAAAAKHTGLQAVPAHAINNAWAGFGDPGPFRQHNPLALPVPYPRPADRARPIFSPHVIDLTGDGGPHVVMNNSASNNSVVPPALPGFFGQRYDMQFQPAYGLPPPGFHFPGPAGAS